MTTETPTGPSLALPKPPVFATVQEERLHRKQRLAATLRLFSKLGFDEGIAGHVTARDPEFLDHFWVNPFGLAFSHVKTSDLIRVNGEGKVVEGERPLNTAAFAIHSEIHAARPDVVAAAHAHTTYGRAWSALSRPLDPIIQEACAFYEDHAIYDDYAGLVLELSEGRRIAQKLDRNKAVVLRGHGLITVGGSVDEAAWWFISLERSCQIQILAESAGKPVLMTPDQARLAHKQFGSARLAWASFQVLWDAVVREQPDLLE